MLNNFDAPLWKLPVFVKGGTILPMYEENNTPDAIDRTSRIVEFWPFGTSEYTAYEDDGKYIRNQTEEPYLLRKPCVRAVYVCGGGKPCMAYGREGRRGL